MKNQEIQKYHSRKTSQNIEDMDLLASIIEQAKYVTLAMVTEEGEPYAVAISHGYDRDENCLYFHTGFEGKKINAMKHQPRVCAFVLQDDGYIDGSCHHAYKSVICYGKISEILDPEKKRAALIKMFYSLEKNVSEAEICIRARRVETMNINGINMLRMDIDGYSGKISDHDKWTVKPERRVEAIRELEEER